MPTIKDIAKAAGVSHGTVSNVLTGKGNVKTEKILLVEKVARELGYVVNKNAKDLRNPSASEVAIVIPNINLARHRDIYTYAKNHLEKQGYEVRLFLTNNIIENDKRALHKAISGQMAGIICVPSNGSESVLCSGGKEFPIIVADYYPNISGAVAVGFDWGACGREIGERLLDMKCKRIALLYDQTHHQEKQLLQGFQDCLQNGQTHAQIINITSEEGFLQIVDFLDDPSGIDLLVTANSEYIDKVQAAMALSRRKKCPPVLTVAGSSIICGDTNLRYEMDYKLCGELCAKTLLQLVSGGKPTAYKLRPDGLKSSFGSAVIKGEHPVRMLTLSSPTSQILGNLIPLCKKQIGVDLKLTILRQYELYDVALSCANTSLFDIARLDVIWLAEMAKRIFMPLDMTGHDFSNIFSRMLSQLPEYYTSVDGIPYSLPFDPSVLVLFYRKDLFSSQIVKRMYYEQTRENLMVPRTFAQYDKVARFFTKRFNESSPTTYGATVAMGSSYSVACEFLPRLNELYQESAWIGDYLNAEDFRKALEEFRGLYQCTSCRTGVWWRDVAREFATGQAAMAIMFMNHASDMIENTETDLIERIGFSSIPGKAPLLGGGVAGFMQNARDLPAACEFMEWIYSDEIAKLITYLGGNSSCRSVYENSEILHRYPWMDEAKNSFSIAVRDFTGGRSFNERQLENALGLAVRNAVLGTSSIEESIEYLRNISIKNA